MAREFWEMKRMEIMLRRKIELQNIMVGSGVGFGGGFSFGNVGGGFGMGGCGGGFGMGGGEFGMGGQFGNGGGGADGGGDGFDIAVVLRQIKPSEWWWWW